MIGWQRLQRRDQIADSIIRRMDADPPAKLLQHINAGSPIGGIDHQVHRAIRLQHIAQGSKSGIRIGQMMQYAGADNLIEAVSQLFHTFDRKAGAAARFWRLYFCFNCSV